MSISGTDISRFVVRPIILLALLVLPGLPLRSQQNSMKFDRITSEQGLSDNYVMRMLQDRYGFMWFGTRDGLNRYDGYQFTTYRHNAKNPHSISDGSIGCIFEDREGIFWVGTHSGGVNRFDRERQQFIHYRHEPGNPETIARGEVNSICEDDEGNLWIGAVGTDVGLSRFDRQRKRFIRYQHNSADTRSLSSDHVTYVCRDISGTIWIGTDDKGLNRYDPATNTFINHHHNSLYSHASTGGIDGLYAAPDGNLWIHSDRRMMLLDPVGNRITHVIGGVLDLPALAPDYLNTVHHDRSGRIWLGTRLNGVHVLDARSRNLFHTGNNPTDPSSLSSNRVFSIYEDASENIWIGTDNGINKLNKRNWSFEYYQHDPFDSNSLSDGEVRSIKRDSKGILWIGTSAGGLNRVDQSSRGIIHYRYDSKNPRSLSENTVNTIYEAGNGELWVGTNNGLNLYDRAADRFLRYQHRRDDPTSIPQSGIWDVLEDGDDTVWLATLGAGLNRLDRSTGKFTRYTHNPRNPHSLSHDVVLCLHRDRRGNMWIGTDGGLNRLDKTTGRFIRYLHDEKKPNSLSNGRVWYIHEDNEGIFWIATSGGGMNRFDPVTEKFTSYTEEDGLVNNTVCAIMEDGHGELWISTNKGLSRFDPRIRKFRNYTAKDGLYISEFHFKACYSDPDGFMYFGGTNGFIKFHPDSITESSFSFPPVLLTSFRVFDKDHPLDTAVYLKRVIHLPHDSNFFSIGFAALDFTNPLHNRYRYKLEGLDATWRETDGRHARADYTDIPAGTYTFHVKSTNNDGTWNEAGAWAVIVIRPAFWQTWWFKGLAALAASATLFGAVYARIGNVRRKGELERRLVEYRLQALRAQMNPHFIFNSLNSILHFIVHHDSEAAHRYLSKFAKLIRLTLEHSKNEWVALADEIESLRFYLDLESIRFDDAFSYTIEVAGSIDPDSVKIPPMLIQPHAENAIKHGLIHRESDGRLLIDIREEEKWIICLVEDNGIGRSTSAAMKRDANMGHRSRGVEITRERLDVLTSLGGERYRFDVEDLFDEQGIPSGTRVEIHIPKEVR